MMSDGGLPVLTDSQLDTIRRIAGSKTHIHCIQFGVGPLQTEDPFMKKLAAQNGGSYQYIDVNDWN